MELLKGKIPPQATDIEAVILGAMMIDRKGIDESLAIVSNPEVFYMQKHQLIFTAIKSLYDENKEIDMLTVVQKLKQLGTLEKVTEYYLIQLTQKVSSSAHIEYHCRILMQKYIARQIIKISNEAIELAFDEKADVFDIMDSITQRYDAITDSSTKGHSSLSWRDAMLEVPKRVEFLSNNDGKITGVPTGLKNTDKHFSGWQKQDLIILGADSGMGKTALVMNNLLAVANANLACGMLSMEMSVIQLAIRSVANESQFHMNQLMRNGFEKDEYFETLISVVDRMKNLPIYIDDQPALTVAEMKRKARAMKRKHGIELLVIDFIQMFSGDKDVRINISEAARELKNIAKELDIPVIALSQLSREVKRDHYKIPQKHHLKESSAIEEAADVIGLIYRPGVYGFTLEDNQDLYERLNLDEHANSCLIVVKNRNGSLGNVPMYFIENKTKYVDPSDMREDWNNDDVPNMSIEDDNPF